MKGLLVLSEGDSPQGLNTTIHVLEEGCFDPEIEQCGGACLGAAMLIVMALVGTPVGRRPVILMRSNGSDAHALWLSKLHFEPMDYFCIETHQRFWVLSTFGLPEAADLISSWRRSDAILEVEGRRGSLSVNVERCGPPFIAAYDGHTEVIGDGSLSLFGLDDIEPLGRDSKPFCLHTR